MKGIIFAAGIGSRLKPFTDYHPKALVPVKGRPAIAWVLDRFIAAGIDDIVVNVHHFPEQIKEYLAVNYPQVSISDESKLLLDTAGGLAKIFREGTFRTSIAPTEPIVVHNADIFTDLSISEMVAAHDASQADATLLVDYKRNASRRFLFDSEKRLHGWLDTRNGATLPATGINPNLYKTASFGGVHVLSGRILENISTELPDELRPYGIVPYYMDNCNSLRIMGYSPTTPYYWFDLGTTEKVAEAEAM